MKQHCTRRKKLESLTSAILFLFSAIVLNGCGNSSEIDELNPATLTVEGTPTEVPYVMTIDGQSVSLDEYRFFYLLTKEQMDQGDENYWNQPDSDQKERELKDHTMQVLKASYAIPAMADQLQLSLTDTEHSLIESDIKNQMETLGGTGKYQKALSEKNLNDCLYRRIWEINFCRQKLWSYYFEEGGPLYISDDALSSDEKQTSYNALFRQMLDSACDELTVQLRPEYDLISIDTLK